MTTPTTCPPSAAGPAPARWATWAAFAAPLCVLPSAVWRTAVSLTGEHRPTEVAYMTVLSVLTVALAFLTVGLVRDWGRVFPRWVPGIGGRRVPARAIVRVARTGGALLVLITLYGVLNSLFGFVDEAPRLIDQEKDHDKPPAWVGYLYLPAAAWGFLVLAVVRDYARRTAGAAPASRPA
ncbi:hypothetical protein [Streptomyces sp. NPDC047725]|uniref:hypothetical protein n=1 Tax=Streptomyces sp. NPDC047725 TaxID=3365487 RepID=UPI00370FC728